MTALELITAAMVEIGEAAQGETISSEDAASGLSRLNELLNSWSNDRLNIYKVNIFSGTISAASHTFGPSGGLTTAYSPIRIQSAFITYGVASETLELIDDAGYAGIKEKAATATIPLKLYVNEDSPNFTLTFWPVPGAPITFTAYYWTPIIGGNLLLSDTLVIFPGYLRALIIGLAMELAPGYGRTVNQSTVQNFQDSYALLRSQNLVGTQQALKDPNAPSVGNPGPAAR